MVRQAAPGPRAFGSFLLVVLSLGAGLVACARRSPVGGEPGRPSSILLVTIDTLRADHLGTYGYIRDTSPNLDALAEESIVFERAMTPMATTLPAHVSIMTSTHPLRHGVVNNSLQFEPGPRFIPFAQTLQDAGYETAAFVSAKPVGRKTGLASGFAIYDQPEDPPRLAEDTVDAFLEWLGGRTDRETPFFAWIHLWDPHSPYDPPAEYASRYEADASLTRLREERGVPRLARIRDVGVDVEALYNAYDGEVRYTDAQLGRVLARLKARGLYDELTLALTSDHGEGLMQHGWLGHGRIYDEQLWVPMMIKPDASLAIAARRIGGVVSTLDLFPTLAGLLALDLGEEIRAQFDGVDRLNPSGGHRGFVLSERVHRQRRGWRPGRKLALTGLRWRVFVMTEGESQLFDLLRDPHELEDVLEQRQEVASRLQRQLRASLAAYRAKPRTSRRPVGGAHEERLRALGYAD